MVQWGFAVAWLGLETRSGIPEVRKRRKGIRDDIPTIRRKGKGIRYDKYKRRSTEEY